jgi:prepilin-type N-terminal cleavage/methylation domain-containing protein
MKPPDWNSRRGFSLIELMVVLLIVMVVAAMSIPTIMTTINNVRLRSMIGTVSGVIQSGRMLAIKANRQYTVRFGTVTGGSSVVFVDLDKDGAPGINEPKAQLGGTIIQVDAPVGTSPLDASILGFDPQSGNLSFNPRGLPCTPPPSSSCNVGFRMYFTDQRRMGGTGYAAVSVTPAGRVKGWMWTGRTWSD